MITQDILMIRPVAFTYNAQTAVNNSFQQQGAAEAAQEKALAEFDTFVSLLRSKGVRVHVVNDTFEPHTPDAIFPNNWISFHSDGTVFLYPMYAENRRAERKPTVLEYIRKTFTVRQQQDLSHYEQQSLFLEGTGSMVLDRDAKIAYACLSPRTDASVLQQFCDATGYTPCIFTSVDAQDAPIYHTNVVMCVAEKQVIICIDSIPDAAEKAHVIATIEQSGKALVTISFEQLAQFAGNMLQIKGNNELPLLVMSSTAYNSLHTTQIETLSKYSELVHSPLNTIETNGGGSARCMMAEVFLTPQ